MPGPRASASARLPDTAASVCTIQIHLTLLQIHSIVISRPHCGGILDVKVMGSVWRHLLRLLSSSVMFCGTRCCCFCWSARACTLPLRLRGVQVRRFGEGFPPCVRRLYAARQKADAEGMSSFQALTTAIAAQVGTGNITGCATALVSGGPARCSGPGCRRFSAWRPFTPRPCWRSTTRPR